MQVEKGTRRNLSSIALPTIADINKPIEKYLYAVCVFTG